MVLGKILINLCVLSNTLNELGIVFDDFSWDPENQAVLWDNHLLGHKSACSDNRT